MRGIIPGGINPDLVALTGSIVVWWGMIESTLVSDVISMNIMPNVQADKECWPVQIATKKLIGQWARARRIIHRDWADEHFAHEAAISTLRASAIIRHRLIHSFWGYGSPKQPRTDFVISTMKPARGKPDTFDVDKYLIDVGALDDFNDSIRRLHTDLMAASLRLHLGLISRQPIAPTSAQPNVLDARMTAPKHILD